MPGIKTDAGLSNFTSGSSLSITSGGQVNVAPSGSPLFPVAFGDSFNLDAFGRVRMSSPTNRLDLEFIYDKQKVLVDEVTAGSGTVTFNVNSRDLTLAVNVTASTATAALYSFDVPYTPGTGQLIETTGTMNSASISGGSAFFFLRSSVSGSSSTSTQTWGQSAWNQNTASSINWTTSQIFACDFQSLKVGRMRLGFVRDGIPVYCHYITNDNIRNTGYWQYPTLPVYWRIYNDATYTYAEMGYGDTLNAVGLRYQMPKSAGATLRAICATVKSEGGAELLDIPGFNRSIDLGVTEKTVSTTLIPLLSIRAASSFGGVVNRALYIPRSFSVTADNPIKYALIYRPATLTTPVWTAVNASYSGIEYDSSASAITGGIVVGSGYLSTGKNLDAKTDGLLERTILRLTRTGTSDVLTVAAIKTGATDSSTLASIEWKEIR